VTADGVGFVYLYKDDGPVPKDKKDGAKNFSASVSSCAVADDGTAVIGLEDGTVLFKKPNENEVKPISELVPFRLTQRVRAVSIDPSGRFVAALGERQSGSCLRPAIGGQSVRLWDLKHPNFPDVPRSSTCFPWSPIVALGMPKQNDDQSWVLPLYEKGSNSTGDSKFPSSRTYPCEACSRPNESPEAVAKRMEEKAKPYNPQLMDSDHIKALYGIEIRQ